MRNLSDPGDWSSYDPFARNLLSRTLSSRKDVAQWMKDYEEFLNIYHEEEARRYICMTSDTRDKAMSRAYLSFKKSLQPQFETFLYEAEKRALSFPIETSADFRKYRKWSRALRSKTNLFHEKNVALNSLNTSLIQEYHRICGAMTVKWEGKNRTVIQMNSVLQSNDRSTREQAYRKTWERFVSDRAPLDRLFNGLLSRRSQMASHLGLPDYRDFCFKKYERTDYSVADCFTFHETVEKVVVPLYGRILEYKRDCLGVKTLRPWDLACDVLRRPPLKPFTGSEALIRGVKKIIKRLDPTFGGFIGKMEKLRLFDLENRPGKRSGGYEIFLDEVRYPFVFMNSINTDRDIFTMLHECGHAIHQFMSRHNALPYNREAPMEFNEVASMGMERLGMAHLDVFFDKKDVARAVSYQDEEVFRLLIWIAIVDSFQHWIYTHPGHSKGERNKVWADTMERYQCGLDWSGLQGYRKTAWHRQLHIFQYPFYYIEYGIALTGALQLWDNSLRNPSGALRKYKSALKCGGTLGLRALFDRAGLKLDFSPKTLKPLLNKVFKEWEENSIIFIVTK